MKYNSMLYEMYWRRNYEAIAAFCWLAAIFCALFFSLFSEFPRSPFYFMMVLSVLMLCCRLPMAIKLFLIQRNLKGKPLAFIRLKKLIKHTQRCPHHMWLGHGFVWENRHAQRVFDILKRDYSEVVNNSVKKISAQQIGQTWIHGVEMKENPLYQLLKHSEGQNLILGTTGAGKTRLFDLLVSQSIMRGEAVIIIDPKGDKELRENARRACEAIGRPNAFINFHPSFPQHSVRIDPLKNFSRSTEIASRLAALIPSEAGADPFKSFGWQALNNIAQGLILTYRKPNVLLLKRFLESGPHKMVIDAVMAYAEQNINNGRQLALDYLTVNKAKSLNKQVIAIIAFYTDVIQPQAPSSEVEALISMQQHDSTHFSKMVANLLPIMNMLTAGDLGELLSPDYQKTDDERIITDNKKIIDNCQVAYFGLDSLSDSTVGSAIGSLILSDLVAVAGDRYNFGKDNRPVNIYVDEASEIINESTIQLLNKGRGGGMKLFIASQTIADFEARLGSKERARQVLGNVNNIVTLRIIDPDTQKFVAENLPKTRIKHVSRSQANTSKSDAPLMFTANTGERLVEEEAELFPSPLLGMLPDLEFIAKISGGTIIKGRIPILVE